MKVSFLVSSQSIIKGLSRSKKQNKKTVADEFWEKQ